MARTTPAEPRLDPAEVEAVGLRYVSDLTPGFRRRRAGRGFCYLRTDGSTVTDERDLSRIKRIAVPPAWIDVWICPTANGHIQATGRDARGRKQYRYHVKWRTMRDETKYGRMIEFGRSLPTVRAWADEQLALPEMPRDKVLATVITLLDDTLIRVGNGEYAKTNDSFGLTTLRNRHAEVKGAKVSFEFKGKSGEKWCISIEDRRLARIVKQCKDLPGYELFQYVEEGARRPVDSGDVNACLGELTGHDFTAKDFRTWGGTVATAVALHTLGPPRNQRDAKRKEVEAITAAAKALGNRPATARKSYVHPAVLESFWADELEATWAAARARGRSRKKGALSVGERVVLTVLERAQRRARRNPLAA